MNDELADFVSLFECTGPAMPSYIQFSMILSAIELEKNNSDLGDSNEKVEWQLQNRLVPGSKDAFE